MDFAEKVMLPSLLRQPGQLHLVTGLKLYLFAISCGNMNKNYIFCLPEGTGLVLKALMRFFQCYIVL